MDDLVQRLRDFQMGDVDFARAVTEAANRIESDAALLDRRLIGLSEQDDCIDRLRTALQRECDISKATSKSLDDKMAELKAARDQNRPLERRAFVAENEARKAREKAAEYNDALATARNQLSTERPTSFGNYKWACGHEGPSVCEQCWSEKLAELVATRDNLERLRVEKMAKNDELNKVRGKVDELTKRHIPDCAWWTWDHTYSWAASDCTCGEP